MQTTISCFGEQAPERKSLVSSPKKQNHQMHSGSSVPTNLAPFKVPSQDGSEKTLCVPRNGRSGLCPQQRGVLGQG